MPYSNATKQAFADALRKTVGTETFCEDQCITHLRRMRMNRKSFYYHFKDKYDLVNWIF